MRRYDDSVEVRRGESEGPEQFLWRGRLWKVRAVLAHWVETAPWWVAAQDGETGDQPVRGTSTDLVAERELWRVEAGRGSHLAADSGAEPGAELGISGVFDLSFDWSDGCWQLVACAD